MRLWQQMMIFLARNKSVKNFMQNRTNMSELATRFVGGKNASEASEEAVKLKSEGIRSSLFYLGEYVENISVINQTVSELQNIAEYLSNTELDIHISVDPTQIGYQVDRKICYDNAIQIAGEIKNVIRRTDGSSNNFLMLDMEDSSITAATISLYGKLKAGNLPTALTLQAYLYRTENDMKKIIQDGGAVRLVKGAFAEGKDIAFTGRSEIDRNFMRLAELMLSDEAQHNGFYPVFGTHDDKLINRIIEIADSRGWEKEKYEFEMLYGVRNDLQKKLVRQGEQVRVYLPFGTDWWSYAVRRVGESLKSAKFLLRSLIMK